ncbi:ubiquitin-like protein Pup [Kocuria coralli]|uniref:Prokaryotic ubiquitin-like protein Pup n=1 Tax=Kocuria coralli TaxID=1461025 RepID=A0A5J5KUF8_9MICC|nr:ubiquitin-like protein Pup [Kocuria coralli]KAA9393339.1 ubiquitin-like protein Pup [Kocuria coralli]
MAQERITSSGSKREEEAPLPDSGPAPSPGGPSAAAQAQASQADDLLADIDAVLEANAEEFVKGFVQKGGQ